MSAQLLDGKNLAKNLQEKIRLEILDLESKAGKVPVVVNIMIGDNHAACAYAKSQQKVAQHVGIDYRLDILDKNVTQADLLKYIEQLNKNFEVNGIMVHKPVPKQINHQEASNYIDMTKDLEGVNISNIGKMLLGRTNIIPCTPAAVMEHIKSTGIDLRGKEVVVVGHSEIVGKPLSLLLLQKMATVTICHVATSEAGKLSDHIARADVLIVAVGKAELIKGSWIKQGAVVIDVGINRVDSKIVGDVEFDVAKKKASFITPVPGGVGPVTVVMLMKNALEAFKYQIKDG
ncbi:MAG: bifunctional 5,10-methylenetetrahydrofolate dehydrogenase/5,10-methenyltetrahydrofolate cyclohydrolase [Candidatus Omnitrophica bacterium]|nr:bifunctional 5,10-methylenetetrahydrofolate dehydrogenase/5,10-methenyltetrahydrofolate cyclohydrolase [Candidatus Omnitrophota bacterium]